MSATMVDPRREMLKLHWLKCPKLLSKHLNQKVNDFHLFYITVLLKKLLSFYEPQCTQHYQKYTLATQPKSGFLVGVRKNICTEPFLDAQKLHSRST